MSLDQGGGLLRAPCSEQSGVGGKFTTNGRENAGSDEDSNTGVFAQRSKPDFLKIAFWAWVVVFILYLIFVSFFLLDSGQHRPSLLPRNDIAAIEVLPPHQLLNVLP